MGDSLVSQFGISDGCSSDSYARPLLSTKGKCSMMLEDADLLPEDPFGMDTTSLYKGVMGWFENVKLDCGEYESHTIQKSVQLPFPKVETFLTEVDSDSEPNFLEMNKVRDECNVGFGLLDTFSVCSNNEKVSSGYSSFLRVGSLEVLGYSEHLDSVLNHVVESSKCFGEEFDSDDGSPHAALFLALGYMDVETLLLMERVCKSLHVTVQGDPLLWRRIHIDKPMSERINDDILRQLTGRAQGNLQCLSVVECQGLTDKGLRLVLESNPKLIELSVSGCTRLTIEGVISVLKAFKSRTKLGIKQLRIGGLYAVKIEHLEELKDVFSLDIEVKASKKPHFYSIDNVYISLDDDRPIDLELCPRCQIPRLVYDCPTQACKSGGGATPHCRACFFCIMRCSRCGICLVDSEYEETFCLDPLCVCCSDKPILKHKLKQYGLGSSSSDFSCG